MATIGMRYVVAAPITTESGADITYGAKQTMKAVEAALNWERDDGKMYADDAVAETDGSVIGYTLDTTVDNMTDEQEAVLFGHELEGGEYVVYGEAIPYSGLGYVRVLKKGGVMKYKALFYPKIQLTRQSENDKTKESSVTWGTVPMHGIGMAVFINSTGKNKFRTHKTFDTMASAVAYLDGKFSS